MSYKMLLQVLCLSLALIQIRAKVLHTERDMQFKSPDQEHDLQHHHGHIHGEQKPLSQMMNQISPLLQSIFNTEYNKNGRIDSTDDTKLETISKARAYLKSIFRTKFTQTEMINKNNNSDNKIVSKTLEQNGETDAIIDFNSNMDVINDKTIKAKSNEELKPLEGKQDRTMPGLAIYADNLQGPNSRRRKRDTTDEHSSDKNQKGESTDNTWKNVVNTFKKAGEAVKVMYKKHVEEPVKKFANDIKNKVDNWKKEHDKKKDQHGKEEHNDEHHENKPEEKHDEEQSEK